MPLTLVNLSKGSAANLLDELVVSADPQIHLFFLTLRYTSTLKSIKWSIETLTALFDLVLVIIIKRLS